MSHWLGDWEKDWEKEAETIRKDLWKESETWTFGYLDPSQTFDHYEIKDLTTREYIQIRLAYLRIPFEQVIGRKYFGTVHSFVSLNTVAAGPSEFVATTTPDKLQDVDPFKLSNVIQEDIPLLGPVPYMGGDVKIQAGVFSIMSQDLIAPFLKAVEDISIKAGVSVISQAIPFVQPIENAIYNLLGVSESNLEIGIYTTLKKQGYLVAVHTPADDTYFSTLSLKKNEGLCDGSGEIKKAYMVLKIETSTTRDDWLGIPEVRKAYENLKAGIATGQKETILKFYKDFTQATLASDDLLNSDAKRINDDVYKKDVEPAINNIAVHSLSRLGLDFKRRAKPEPTKKH